MIAEAPSKIRSTPVGGVAPSVRMPALDALRGIASLAVVWYHVYRFSSLPELLQLPSWADLTLRFGFLGVEVFFVLSGVVIALSLAGDRITWSYAGRFALRRSIRLDPPYWTTLFLASAILAVGRGSPPPARVLAAHVVYLQNVLGYQNIVSQFWTLCYEIQFYLALILFLAIAQYGGKFAGWVVAVVPLMISLGLSCTGAQARGWFVDWWYAFAFGVATTGMLTGRLRLRLWGILAAVLLGIGVILRSGAVATVALTGLAIGLVGRWGKLSTWTGGPVLQWLGRISYSLYLIHFPGSALAKAASARVHSQAGAAMVFVASTAVALVAAQVLYWAVERPAQRWSKRIRVRA